MGYSREDGNYKTRNKRLPAFPVKKIIARQLNSIYDFPIEYQLYGRSIQDKRERAISC
jgi:hypothetical protein